MREEEGALGMSQAFMVNTPTEKFYGSKGHFFIARVGVFFYTAPTHACT
jgi:hypothetical protein